MEPDFRVIWEMLVAFFQQGQGLLIIPPFVEDPAECVRYGSVCRLQGSGLLGEVVRLVKFAESLSV